MINGFEHYTFELNHYEMKLLEIIIPKLILNVGKKNAVKNKDIIRKLKLMGFEKITPARIRKIISHIRVNKLIKNLIATSKGYYRAETQKEVDSFKKSLRQRANIILAVEKSFN